MGGWEGGRKGGGDYIMVRARWVGGRGCDYVMVGARWVRGRREGVTTSWWELHVGGWVGGRVCDYVMMGARWVGGREGGRG